MLNLAAKWTEECGMTFADQLDAILAGAPPTLCSNTQPDDRDHAWFVDLHVVQSLDGVATIAPPPRRVAHLSVAPTPQTQHNTPQDMPERRAWSTEQCRVLAVLRSLGAPICDDADDVRRAWRRVAKRLHPDTGGSYASAADFHTAARAWEHLRHGPTCRIGRDDLFVSWRQAS
jgi:hypothetical protein